MFLGILLGSRSFLKVLEVLRYSFGFFGFLEVLEVLGYSFGFSDVLRGS